MENLDLTHDDGDTLYEVLNFYIERNKKLVCKLQEKDCDDLNDDEFILVSTYHSAQDLRVRLIK